MHCERGATGLSANSNSQEYSENAAWASATAIYEIGQSIDIDMGEWLAGSLVERLLISLSGVSRLIKLPVDRAMPSSAQCLQPFAILRSSPSFGLRPISAVFLWAVVAERFRCAAAIRRVGYRRWPRFTRDKLSRRRAA